MFVRNISLPIINNFKLSTIPLRAVYSQRINYSCSRFYFSNANQQSNNYNPNEKATSYMPIRPLKKNLTPLFVDKQLLNKNQVQKSIPYWPFLTPWVAMCINNYLTTWSIVHTTIAYSLFFLGFLVRSFPQYRRQRQIIKFECNKQMNKFYMTIHDSIITFYLNNNYGQSYKADQQWKTLSQQELKVTQYIPTQQELKTLTPQQLQAKKQQFDDKLLKKIMRQDKITNKISRYELDASSTLFKLSDLSTDKITDQQLIHPHVIHVQQALNLPQRYLIVRTEFLSKRKKRPYHFFIDLERNGDLKYQDYLIALGVQAKILKNSQTK